MAMKKTNRSIYHRLFYIVCLLITVCAIPVYASGSSTGVSSPQRSTAQTSETGTDDDEDEDDEDNDDDDEDNDDDGQNDSGESEQSSSSSLSGVSKLSHVTAGAPCWVFLGDSYAKTTRHPNLPGLIADALGLEDRGGYYMTSCMIGAGTAKTVRSFWKLLKKLPSSRKVTDVLIIGGINNDRNHSRKEIENGMKRFAKLARFKYPNARLMYAIPQWTVSVKQIPSREARERVLIRQIRIKTRMPWYKEACRKNGIYFLSDVRLALRGSNNKKYFKKDLHHPSDEGLSKIAQAVKKAVRKLDKTTKVRSISLNRTTLSLRVKDRYRLSASVRPKKAASQAVYFSSDRPDLCEVGRTTGVIKALRPGFCQITCTAADGSGTYSVCRIQVRP